MSFLVSVAGGFTCFRIIAFTYLYSQLYPKYKRVQLKGRISCTQALLKFSEASAVIEWLEVGRSVVLSENEWRLIGCCVALIETHY